MFSQGPSRLRPVVGVALLALLGSSGMQRASARERIAAVAVFPVENLSSGSIPGAQIKQSLIDKFSAEGVRILGDDALEAFMARHRIRYGAGVDAATAQLLRQETGVDGIVIASVELSSSAVPPKVALFVRLVSIATTPVVVWADDTGMSGDDAPGLFELGLVNDYELLQARAFDRLGRSLAAYLGTGQTGADPKPASKFRPKAFRRTLSLEPGRSYSVAVVPFFNLSARRNAGEILALHFIRHLSSFHEFRIVDTGVTRQQLLDARIIMDGGLSISDAETVAALIEADFVLAGRVLRYEDYEGLAGKTGVEFSTALIEKKSRKVVWSSNSYNLGSDGMGLFEHGASRTAHAVAAQMVRLTTELIAGRER